MTAQLLRERPTGYAFSHSLLRDGVYWGLSRTRRMLLHGRAGEVLEVLAGDNSNAISAELAYHFSRAGQTAPIRLKALHYSLRAGRQAAALASHREALQHFEVAATLVSDPALKVDNETRLAALEGRGAAEDGMGMWPSCVKTFRQVLDLAPDPLTRARARRMISFELHHLGDTVAALHEAEAGLAELGSEYNTDRDASIIRLGLQHQLGLLLFLRGRFSDVLGLGNEMVELATKLQEPRWLAWAQHVIAWAHTGSGRTLEAIEQYEVVVSTAEQGHDKLDVAADLTNLGLECYRARRFAEAQQHLERAVTLYRESFSDFRSVLGLQGLGWVHLALGNIAHAQEYADVAVGLARQVHDRWLAECLQLLSALHMIRAEWADAKLCVEQASEILDQVGHSTGTIDVLIQLGRIAAQEDSHLRARELYEKALRAAEQIDPSPSLVAAHRTLGLLLLRTHEVAAGAAQIQQAVTVAETMPDSLEYNPTLLALAELKAHQGDIHAALRAVDGVLGTLNPAPLRAEAEVLYSELLLLAGRLDDADRHAALAMALAETLGAPLLLGMAYRAAGQVALATEDRSAETHLRSALQHFEAAAALHEAARVKEILQQMRSTESALKAIHHSSRHPYSQ
jgi:tetratricopeptide (TPR) repeat protein